MQFLKNVLAVIVGFFISTFLIGLFSFLIILIFLLIGSASSSYYVEKNTVLKINLSGIMKDKTTDNYLADFLGVSEANEISLTDIILAIEEAKTNDNIHGIYIYAGNLLASTASLNELREELTDFKDYGKFIVAYSNTYLQSTYFLSSVADEVIINPEGMLDLHGIAANLTFYKKTLDKIGVDMQIFKVGTYKSAVEPFTEIKASEANTEQITSYINSVWNKVLTSISESRGVSIDELNTITDSLPMFQSTDFLIKHKLVDRLMYESGVETYITSLLNIDDNQKITFASVSDLTYIKPKKQSKIAEQNKIAVLYAEGNIQGGSSRKEISDRYLIKQIQLLAEDDQIKGVVFRVNSPGGSAFASEQIWKAITDLKALKPVYVSMGDYAASGGYYISCNADKIYALPTTLTGSIGIFGMFPNIEGLTDKIGLTFTTIKTNNFADFGDITRPMREDEKRLLQAYVERGYDLFLKRCSEGRNIPITRLDSIAQGRVWTGSQALELGLVDELGGVQTAINDMASDLQLADFSVVRYPEPPGAFDYFFDTTSDDIAAYLIKQYLGEEYEMLESVRRLKEIKETDFIQARMPFEITVK